MESTIKMEPAKAMTKLMVLVTSDRLRELANELDRARKAARHGDTAMVSLSESIILASDAQ